MRLLPQSFPKEFQQCCVTSICIVSLRFSGCSLPINASVQNWPGSLFSSAYRWDFSFPSPPLEASCSRVPTMLWVPPVWQPLLLRCVSRCFFLCMLESLGIAMATFCGQNYGAGKPERIWTGVKAASLMMIVYVAAVAIILSGDSQRSLSCCLSILLRLRL